MKIVITMAGNGMRFKKIGFMQPKYQIVVRGRTLFSWSMESLRNFFGSQFLFVVKKSDSATDFIQRACDELGIKSRRVIEVGDQLFGQAVNVLDIENYVKVQDSILIYNIDSYVEPDQFRVKDIRGDGWVPCFKVSGDKWSFIEFNDDCKVKRSVEKIRISPFGTPGLYYFSSYSLFKTMFLKTDFSNVNEKYIAPIYQTMIDHGYDVYTTVIDSAKVHILGTPEDVLEFDPDMDFKALQL